MAPEPTIKVEGAKTLRRTMKKAGQDLGDLKEVHQRVGDIVATAGRANAPVLTGALAGSVRPTRLASGATVRSRLPYAAPIHWGWPAHNIDARPFLSDAATETEPTWTDLYFREVERIIGTIEGDK